jgi:hypothetical protein
MIIKYILAVVISTTVFYSNAQSSLKKTTLIKGLTMKLPKDFVVMADDDIAQKYPTHKKPLAMYNNVEKTADFGLNFAVNRWNNKNLSVLRDIYKSTISSVFTNVVYKQEGIIKKINGKDFIVFEFVSELVDDKRVDNRPITTRNYSYIQYTLADKKILIFNFTTTVFEKDKWASIASEMMESIEISDKLEITDYVPVEANQTKKVEANDPQMKIIKGMKNNKAKRQE